MFRFVYVCGVLCLSLVLVACGGGSSGSGDTSSSSPTATPQSIPSETTSPTQEIIESIYTNQRTPNGFYTEPQPDPGEFETIAHIKNINVLSTDDYDETTPRYELCSDDFAQTLDWSLASDTGLGDLVNNSEHTIYYQFTYSDLALPQQSNLQRVYKCSVIDRSALDIRDLGAALGRYSETPQNQSTIKLLIEYLWSFTLYNNYGNAIISSVTSDAGDYYLHRMEHARLTTAAELSASCDRIDVYQVNYRIQKDDGEITVSEAIQRTIYSRNVNDQMEVCEE